MEDVKQNGNEQAGSDEQQLINESELMPILEAEAKSKGLQTFIFKDEELREYYENANPDVGIALMAANKYNATINLQRLKRCYLIRLDS